VALGANGKPLSLVEENPYLLLRHQSFFHRLIDDRLDALNLLPGVHNLNDDWEIRGEAEDGGRLEHALFPKSGNTTKDRRPTQALFPEHLKKVLVEGLPPVLVRFPDENPQKDRFLFPLHGSPEKYARQNLPEHHRTKTQDNVAEEVEEEEREFPFLKKPQGFVLQRRKRGEGSENPDGEENTKFAVNETTVLDGIHDKAQKEAPQDIDEEGPKGKGQDVPLHPPSHAEAEHSPQRSTKTNKEKVFQRYPPSQKNSTLEGGKALYHAGQRSSTMTENKAPQKE
jgi:hypothetical protein